MNGVPEERASKELAPQNLLHSVLNRPQKIGLAPDGSVFIADRPNPRIRKVDAQGVIHIITGAGTPKGMLLDPEAK